MNEIQKDYVAKKARLGALSQAREEYLADLGEEEQSWEVLHKTRFFFMNEATIEYAQALDALIHWGLDVMEAVAKRQGYGAQEAKELRRAYVDGTYGWRKRESQIIDLMLRVDVAL
jgi:hypothetical protein